MSKVARVGVDVGFGFIKAMNSKGDSVEFPSVYKVKTGMSSLQSAIGGINGDFSLTYAEIDSHGNRKNEQSLYVGELALANNAKRTWADKNAKMDADLVKKYVSVAVAHLAKDATEADVCVGLPMSYYTDTKKQELVNILKGAKIAIQFEREKEQVITLRNVFTFPQGGGAYYSSFLTIDGKLKDKEIAKSSVAVIDVGYRTVDFLVMGRTRKGTVMLDDCYGSLEESGMNNVFNNIQVALQDQLREEVPLSIIEQAILWDNNKLSYRGKKIDLSGALNKYSEELARDITNELKRRWKQVEATVDYVIIAGGGGEALFPYLKDAFHGTMLADNSSFANVKGYLAVAAKASMQQSA